MKDSRKTFHKISYLQYPLMVIAFIYCYKPIVFDMSSFWIDFNTGLVFLGLGMSFSTLQDTTKTQNKLSRKIYERPMYSRWFFIMLVVQIIVFTGLGIYGLFSDGHIKDLSFGFIALGIGVIGMLKSAIEMAEYVQKEKTNSSVGDDSALQNLS